MVGNNENILVEFDYNNISIIDPNKIIDENGKAKERLVKHENLVMYANLECKVIPRTKLLIGASNSDNLRTISVTSMNFLNPGDKTFLDNAYTDEITGKGSLKGEGVNQQRISRNPPYKSNKSQSFYYTQSTYSNKEPKATDNGLIGIKSISIKQGLDFEPVVNIKLEDVKGRALFESGNDSPYSAFFNLPYPLFYLTLKGYYGKAIRLPLMLQDFTSSYNTGTGNFDIELTLYTYKFSVISEVSMGAMIATPHMYKSIVRSTPKTLTAGLSGLIPNVNIPPVTQSGVVGSLQNKVTNSTQSKSNTKGVVVEYGTQKIKEVYSEYKSKGLLPEDFPEITVVQMQKRIDQFIQRVLDEFTKQNLDPLTNISIYLNKLTEYRGEVYYYYDSWFNKYMDTVKYYVIGTGPVKSNIKIYSFKPEFVKNTETVTSELKSIIKFYNEELNSNETCGKNGQYEIDGKIVPCSISNKVNYNIIEYPFPVTDTDIDFEQTYIQRNGSPPPEESRDKLLNDLRVEFDTFVKFQATTYSDLDGDNEFEPNTKFFVFEGPLSFIGLTDKMLKERDTKQTEIETALTEALAKLIKSKNSVLGFIPTIRNVLGVIFANGEAYLRLLDEVHTKAWNQRDSPIRKAPIFSTKANPDAKKIEQNVKAFVYPWPEFIKETPGVDGQEKYETKYPGDPDIINETKAFLYEQWPEVEFVEEFCRALTVKIEDNQEVTSDNEVTDSKRISLNTLEYPTNNNVFNNKEEAKFFFEIYERLILSSYYTKLVRTTDNSSDMGLLSEVISEFESINVTQSLAANSPFLQEKLVNYGFNSNNFIGFLKQASNQGVGISWQNFIRGIFNTPYIKNLLENKSFSITKLSAPTSILNQIINSEAVSPAVSSEKEEDIRDFLENSTKSNEVDFTDTLPFTDLNWNRNNLSGNQPIPSGISNLLSLPSPSLTPQKEFYDTRKTLFYNSSLKVFSNFTAETLNNTLLSNEIKPFSSFNFKKIKMPSTASQTAGQPELNLNDLRSFYSNRNRKYNIQLPTEGPLNYSNKPGLLPRQQTISILNTPFFANSIQDGVSKFRNFDDYPYIIPAYLFLNSLPLATLKEKYATYTEATEQEEEKIEYLNYIFSTFKKYNAIHKISYPWVLKLGSVWHRYKTWIETGQDILDVAWKNFDTLGNFDPLTSASTTTYSLTLQNSQNVDITLQKDTSIGSQTFTQINTGFYPQTLNDFNVFYQGFRLFTGYTNSDIQIGIISGLTLISSSDANILMDFGGDSSNPDRLIQINAWSAYATSLDKKDCYIMPSHGANINQVKDECFENGTKKIEVSNNKSVFNGSVRTYWNAPTYGYFDVLKIVKPKPDEYMKKVFGGVISQENFSLNSTGITYSTMSEIFSVFTKEMLDEFESQFLNFCRPKYNYVDSQINVSSTENSYGNFQLFLTSLMKVPAPDTGLTFSQTIDYLQEQQTKKFALLINGFLNYDVLITHSNPSNFDKKLFYTFSNKELTDGFVFERYSVNTPNALPTTAGTQTLVGSKLQYPEEWKTLLEYVGFSEIPKVIYTNTGSTIFDFFIDNDIAFTEKNIKICSPIIKIYATKKLENKTLNQGEFFKLMDAYINKCDNFLNKTLDNLFQKIRKKLDGIQITKDKSIVPAAQGNQTKLELYQTFKATNDKWISGGDFKTKTLFEDVLLFDRASRNIGDSVIVDIYKLRELLDPAKLNMSTNMLIIVKTILAENNFQVMNIPAFVNFYNVQDATKNPTPKPEGSLELANTLFGTFLNVDYRESSTKMVCFYANKPSTQLDTESIIQGWKNDSFDLRRASDNPLIEEQTNKRDWDKSNKVVGFNVDIGPQNQGVFTSFSVSQKNNTPTAESLQILSEMSRQAGNRNVATQNLSLYNLYKLRSYDCNINMMGNAMIQPMMFFNLRYVPMFAGPYMITEVSHQIQPGTFTTSVNGVRQSITGLPIQVDLIQSLRTNLVQKIIKQRKEDLEKQKLSNSKNTISDKNKIINNSTGKNEDSNTSECSGITKYETYTKVSSVKTTTPVTVKYAKDKIKEIADKLAIPQQNFDKLAYSVFSQLSLQSGVGMAFQSLENNFIGIDLNDNWGVTEKYFSKPGKFFCVKRKDEILPYVVFDSIDDNIEFLLSRWKLKAGLISDTNAETIAIFINTNIRPNSSSPSNWFSLEKADRDNITGKVQNAINLYKEIV